MSRTACEVMLSVAAAAGVALTIGCGEVAVDSGSLLRGDAGPKPQGERRAQDAADVSVPDLDGGSTAPPGRAQLDAAMGGEGAVDAAAPPKGSSLDAGFEQEDAADEHDAATEGAAFEDDASLAACAEDEARCEGMTPFVCSDKGVFEPTAPCEGPAWICEDGACVQNETTALGLAQATATERELAARHFYATRVSTDGAATLRELAVLGLQAGGAVRVALYGDRVEGGASRPGTFIAGGIDRLRITGGVQRTSPRGWHELSAETTYWVVAITSTTPSIVYEDSHAQSGIVSAPWPAGFSFAGSFPQEFPTDEIEEEAALRLSFYLGVQTLEP